MVSDEPAGSRVRRVQGPAQRRRVDRNGARVGEAGATTIELMTEEMDAPTGCPRLSALQHEFLVRDQ